MMKRGFAMVYQMLVSVIVLLLVSAILLHSRHQVFTARGEMLRLRAQYAAEAGLSCAMAELSRDPAWSAGFSRQSVPGDAAACFSLSFGPSVNNLRGLTPQNSELGVDTVPPRTALLTVTGEANGYRQILQAFVSGGGSWSQGAAILASHEIDMNRDVFVDGFQSLRGVQAIPGNVHSNLATGPRAVHWSGSQLRVSGTLSTVSGATDAILLEGPASVSQTRSDAPYRPIPRIDVAALVARLNTTPGPPLAGNPVILDGGTHCYSDLVINGDLELRNGARLVVSGDLTVNGSVGGEGAVIVDGNASLHGDSRIAAGPADYISVLASGYVSLSGFNGSAYLDALAAADPPRPATPQGNEAAELWSDIKAQVNWVNNFFLANPSPNATTWADTRVDAHLAVLGQGSSSWGYSSNPTQVTSLPGSPRRNSSLALAGRITGSGATPTFLRQRFVHLDDLFRASNYTRSGDDGLGSRAGARKYKADMLAYLNGSGDPARSGGLLDIAQSAWTSWTANSGGDYRDWTAADIQTLTRQLIPELIRQVDLIDYDRLGAAQFRGLVYARGGILADDEISVVGSMVCSADPALSPITLRGVNLRPGQIHLANHSRFTYIHDMFQNGAGNLVDVGVLGVLSWRLRN